MEWIVVLVIVAALFLLLVPHRLGGLFRGLGRVGGEFRKGRLEVEREIRQEYHDALACSRCGKSMPTGAKVCPSCGAEVT
jgi:Sec-independent protein translocase protein TatA